MKGKTLLTEGRVHGADVYTAYSVGRFGFTKENKDKK